MAFVEFQDVRYAAQAMAARQGSLLLSSDRGPIRIEYAKSKMAEVGFTNLWIEVGFQLSIILKQIFQTNFYFSTGIIFSCNLKQKLRLIFRF